MSIKDNNSNIQFLIKEIVNDSYTDIWLDNTFCAFKSINDLFYLIYANENNSIISFNLITTKKINEIKNSHNEYITNFRHFLDIDNKRDLIISISADDNNLKMWDISDWKCLLNLVKINKIGCLYSACFLREKNKNYIITSNAYLNDSESIKIFDLEGNKLDELNNSNDETYFIDSYYSNILSRTYIITGNFGFVKSYDFNSKEIFHKYNDQNKIQFNHYSLVMSIKEKITKLIESCEDGIVRIWDFNLGLLLNKIIIMKSLYGINLWNDDYLLVCCYDEPMQLINLNNLAIIKIIDGHNQIELNIKKIIFPQNRECLISQGFGDKKIKLSNKECNILRYLFEKPTFVAEKEALIDKVWGLDSEFESNSLEVFMSFLRKKLIHINANFSIQSIRGVGYQISPQ